MSETVLLVINTSNLTQSYVYYQQDQHPFHSMTIDIAYGKVVLGGVKDTGEILITKAPYDSISTQSFLQDRQDLNMQAANSGEYELIGTSNINTPVTSTNYVLDSYAFTDLNQNSTVEQTVVYLNTMTANFTVYKGNTQEFNNFSYNAS